jgi:subtilase family serine protease
LKKRSSRIEGINNVIASHQRQNAPASRGGTHARTATSISGALFAVSTFVVAGAATPARADTAPVVHAAGPASHQLTPLTGYSPAVIETAYGISPLLRSGIDGAGETVAIPELSTPGRLSLSGNATDIRQDLVRFDSRFHLPAATLHVDTTITGSSAPYNANYEEVEDVEVLHAVAPKAAIEVVLLPPNVTSSGTDFTRAVVEIVHAAINTHASVVSLSGSFGEHYLTSRDAAAMHDALSDARHDDITFVAASGDSGAVSDNGPPREVSLPASDPLVLAAGGTTLTANRSSGAYVGEVAWQGPFGQSASGGGFSSIYPRPAYQDGVNGITSMRGVPDVSADADHRTGMTLVFSNGSKYMTTPGGGTSASAPLWAGVVALADQVAGRHLGFVNAGIYRIATSTSYGAAFHDVTTGDNTVSTSKGTVTGYQASPGWDPVTGWGSPNAHVLVPLLAKAVQPGDGTHL